MKKKIFFVLIILILFGGIFFANINSAKILKNKSPKEDIKINKSEYILLCSESDCRANIQNPKKIADNIYLSNLSERDLVSLAKNKKIKVYEQKKYSPLLQNSTVKINATSTWNLVLQGTNLTGTGQSICIIDTGANYSHPDLGGGYGAGKKILSGYDVVYGSYGYDFDDGDGHGTHVAGIAAANGSISGVAPGANLIIIAAWTYGANVFYTSDLILALDQCIQNSSRYNISVISMSLGGGQSSSYCDEEDLPLSLKIQEALNQNISVVVATGNTFGGYTNASAGISNPACFQNVTRAGATNKDDSYASYGFRNFNFPDILFAPGTSINSTNMALSYEEKSGTSMAAPHVAGAIAIINQYLRLKGMTKTPSEIENILNASGKQIYDSSSGRYFSRIDIYSAIRSLCSDNLTNTSWQNLGEIQAYPENESVIYNFSRTQFDLNNCGFEMNLTSYCSEEEYNLSTNWTDLNTIITQDLVNQTRNVTHVYSNRCNNSENFNLTEYRSIFRDNCVPNWTVVRENNSIWYNDTNNCYGQTNLSSDLFGRPLNVTISAGENKTEIMDENNETVLELNFNFSNSTLWNSINITRQNETENFSYRIIKGINLTENISWLKTIYIDQVLESGLFCLIDEENIGLENFSSYCNSSSSEKKLFCPGTNENYSCTENGTKFKITGLRNSGIKEIAQFCGDGSCNNGELCSSCSADCGGCPSPSPSGGGGGGGGGGVQSYTITDSEILAGISKNFPQGSKAIFRISEINHSLTVTKINSTKKEVILLIKSDPINLTLAEGEDTKLNLTSPDYFDLYLKLENIGKSGANISIKAIYENRLPEKEKLDEATQEKITKENYPRAGLNNFKNYYSAYFGAIIIIFLILLMIIIKRKGFYTEKAVRKR